MDIRKLIQVIPMTVDEIKTWVGKHRFLWIVPVGAFLISSALATTDLLEEVTKAKEYVHGLMFGTEMPIPGKWVKYHVIDCCDIEYPLGWVITTPEFSDDILHARLTPPKKSSAAVYGLEVVFQLGETVDRAWFDTAVPEVEKPNAEWRDSARVLRPADRELVYAFKLLLSEGQFWHRKDVVQRWEDTSLQDTDLFCNLNADETRRQSLPILTRIGEERTDLILAVNHSQVFGSNWSGKEQLFWSYVSCGASNRQFDHVRRFCDDFFSRLNVGTEFCAEP
ncbi:hypothetical protein GOB74_20175 [Sinorhizobium meliloti]|nr:hypothetical protein [Sinorhizobium meliloti]